MKSAAIRSEFLDYFAQRKHAVVASSPLVPGNDPSLLFTNAGMVQFKDVFLGLEQRDFNRAASSQRCVRAGGKHNDLDNVGYTARHHTFFEMLGNFSFGDYFKREAIEYAWELLTERFGLPPEKLWITVFETDDGAATIWHRHIGIDPKRITRCGEKDNFWMMGNTGPCGPCTEIFYDHGPEIAGGPPGTAAADGDRFIEIWNLVFMQYERSAAGDLKEIAQPSVDTGMGLERIAAVLQGVHDNYDIDLFRNLIAATEEIAPANPCEATSLRVIVDHIRACAFLIMDGVVPANEGRGYVLRRIMRRALRHGHKLGFVEPFFYRLVAPLEVEMGDAIPDLKHHRERIETVIQQEELRFTETLDQGMKIFAAAVADLNGDQIPGEVAFKLNDTYGFPIDLTADIARERGLSVDFAGYDAALEAQRERARAASQFANIDTVEAISAAALIGLNHQQEFTGYDTTCGRGEVLALFRDGETVDKLETGDRGVVVLDRTPFYAESGGQIGDRGKLCSAESVFAVEDTRKQGEMHLHFGVVTAGDLLTGNVLDAAVDEQRRAPTQAHHSATHLLHAALRRVLGAHVEQKGSLVEPQRLRFDFAHRQPVTRAELREIEQLVNHEIRRNVIVETELMSYPHALEAGAIALFGEKYGEAVRVLRMGDFSIELCGGTHVDRTGDIGLFRITSEGGVAAGVRRIEAVTGQQALDAVHGDEELLHNLATLLKSNIADIEGRLQQLLTRARAQEKELQALKAQLATGAGGRDLAAPAVMVGEVNVIAQIMDGVDIQTLREAVDKLKDKLSPAAIVLATVEDGKVRLVAGVTKALSKRLAAGELVNFVAQQVGGKGGGRPDLAQAGGNDPRALDAALAGVVDWVTQQLG